MLKFDKTGISAILVLFLLFTTLSTPFANAFNFNKTADGLIIETPCPQQKAAHGQAVKLCQSYNILQYFSSTAAPMLPLLSISEKINLLMVLGLLIMSPIYLIFKPPKQSRA